MASAIQPWRDGSLYRPLEPVQTSLRQPLTLTTVPYYAWANRAPGAMRVRIPKMT